MNKIKIPDSHYEFAISIGLSPIKEQRQVRVEVNSQLFDKKSPRLQLKLAEILGSSTFHFQNFEVTLAAGLAIAS